MLEGMNRQRRQDALEAFKQNATGAELSHKDKIVGMSKASKAEEKGKPDKITMLMPDDVLMGRGARATENEGNVRFRQLVRTHLKEYLAARRRQDKDQVAREILTKVKSRQGRFLRRLEKGDFPEGATAESGFICVEDEVALLKVKQALRDQKVDEPGSPPTESSGVAPELAHATAQGPAHDEAAPQFVQPSGRLGIGSAAPLGNAMLQDLPALSVGRRAITDPAAALLGYPPHILAQLQASQLRPQLDPSTILIHRLLQQQQQQQQLARHPLLGVPGLQPQAALSESLIRRAGVDISSLYPGLALPSVLARNSTSLPNSLQIGLSGVGETGAALGTTSGLLDAARTLGNPSLRGTFRTASEAFPEEKDSSEGRNPKAAKRQRSDSK